MDTTTVPDALLARIAERTGIRQLARLGSLLLAGLVILVVAFAAGVLAMDLLIEEPEAVAAPFRWRVK